MTPQHMVEHLLVSTKSILKRHGEPEGEPTKGQLAFKQFIANGALIQHRTSDKTKDDLPALKYGSLDEAISHMPEAVDRFYNHFKENPDFKCYNNFMGELDYGELEIFTYQHFRWHLYQFGLIEEFAAAATA